MDIHFNKKLKVLLFLKVFGVFVNRRANQLIKVLQFLLGKYGRLNFFFLSFQEVFRLLFQK